MRLFYDQYVSRRHADLSLVLADLVTCVAAVLFVTGMVQRSESPWDLCFLLVWVAVPRCVGRCLEQFRRGSPQSSSPPVLRSFGPAPPPWRRPAIAPVGCRSRGPAVPQSSSPPAPQSGSTRAAAILATAFLVLFEVLVLAGRELLGDSVDGWQLWLLLTAWAAGALLFWRHAYRLHDLLLLALVLTALYEGRPWPFLWGPLFAAGWLLSSAIRHQLHNVFEGVREPPINLQNARALGLGAAVVAVAVCVVLTGVLSLCFPEWRYESPEPAVADVVDEAKDGIGLRRSGDGTVSRADVSHGAGQGRGVRPSGSVGFARSAASPALLPGYLDEQVVFAAAQLGEDAPPWTPDGRTLWRMRSFSDFDPVAERWVDRAPFQTVPWPDAGEVAVSKSVAGTPVSLGIEVMIPTVLNAFVCPYQAASFGPLLRTPQDTEVGLGGAGDVYPSSTLRPGELFVARFAPCPLSPVPEGSVAGTPAYDGYLAVPDAAALGVDVRAVANTVFGPAATPGARIARLSAFFSSRFHYEKTWSAGIPSGRLKAFLEERRTGDCVCFASTAALLLRAGGVPARLIVGFAGGEWDGQARVTLIKGKDAHAWVEVLLHGSGWVPIDPTAWVPMSAGAEEKQQTVAANEAAQPVPAVVTGPVGTGRAAVRRDGRGLRPVRRSDAAASGGTPTLSAGERAMQRRQSIVSRLRTWQQTVGIAEPVASADSSPPPHTVERTTDAAVGGEKERPAETWSWRSLALRAAILVIGLVMLALTLQSIARKTPLELDEEPPPEPLGGSLHETVLLAGNTPRLTVLRSYQELQFDLERTRCHRRQHESPREHATRFSGWSVELDDAFAALVERVYAALYGIPDMTEADVAAAREAAGVVMKHLG